MPKWSSALDDAIIQRQWQAKPSGAVGGVRRCALPLGVDGNAAPAPRSTARRPGRESCWRQTSSVGGGPSAGPGGAGIRIGAAPQPGSERGRVDAASVTASVCKSHRADGPPRRHCSAPEACLRDLPPHLPFPRPPAPGT